MANGRQKVNFLYVGFLRRVYSIHMSEFDPTPRIEALLQDVPANQVPVTRLIQFLEGTGDEHDAAIAIVCKTVRAATVDDLLRKLNANPNTVSSGFASKA